MSLTREQQKEQTGEICNNMKALYADFRSGALKREDIDSGANVAGKHLKGLQLLLAHDLRDDGLLQFNFRVEQHQKKALPKPKSRRSASQRHRR